MGIPLFVGVPGPILSLCRWRGFIALNQIFKEPRCVGIFNSFGENRYQSDVINVIKEFLYIALQSIAHSCIVLARFLKHFLHSFDSFVCAFADATRKRIGYKSWLENRIQNIEDSMMKNTVSYCRFVNMTKLWVGNIKIRIRIVFVVFVFKISTKLKNIMLKIFFKFQDINFQLLALLEFIPRQKQIFRIGYLME